MLGNYKDYIGIGTIDVSMDRTLVYSIKNDIFYIATTNKKIKESNVKSGVATGFTLLILSVIRIIKISGVLPLIILWALSFIIGYLFVSKAMNIQLELIESNIKKEELLNFLKIQNKKTNSAISIFLLLIIIVFALGYYYLIRDNSISLICSSLLVSTLPMIYFSGIHKRKQIILQKIKQYN
ncbi:hypothetical protein [Streptococcus iniae]